jgi:hypothetical protein
MARQEIAIPYWDETTSNSFWVKDAMEGAVGVLWAKNFHNTDMPDTIIISVDRERGVVTAMTEEES